MAVLAVFVLHCGLTLQAQNTKKFRGAYVFQGYPGAVQFEYFQVRRDSIVLNGQFDFSQKYTDTLDNQLFHKFQVSGRYLNNQKTGSWQYIDAEHRIAVKDVAYFNVKAALDSEQQELTANYDEVGAPTGNWSYKILRYRDEEIIDALFSEGLKFSKGSVIGPFSFVSDAKEGYFGLYRISGQTTTEGLMDSVWTFQYVRDTLKIKELRQYDRGFLLQVAKLSDNGADDTLFYQAYEETARKLDIIRNGGSSLFKISEKDFGLDFISGFDPADKRYLTQQHGNKYLKEIFEGITRFNTAYYFEDGVEVNWPIKTKRFEFQVTPEEDSLRIIIRHQNDSLQSLLSEFRASATVELNRKRTDSLHYASAYMDLIDSLSQRISSPVNIVISDDYKYFDSFAYLKEHDFNFMTIDAFGIDAEKPHLIIERDFNRTVSENASLVYRVFDYIEQMVSEARYLSEIINQEMAQLQIGNELKVLQSQIITGQEELVAQFKQIRPFSKEERELCKALRSTFLEDQFEEFTKAYGKDNFEATKVDKAKDFLEMLDLLEYQIRPLGSIYRNQAILDTLYMEEVFNPFTYTSYMRRVKEDLYTKGNQLFDHYVSELKTTTDFRMIPKWIANIEQLQKELKRLRNVDTRGLERSLRGKKDPLEIESLLQLNPKRESENG